MNNGFEGLMMSNIWNGLQIKKDKNLRRMPLHVVRVDGKGQEKVVFQDIQEFKFPNEYTLVGTCTINNKEHTFEYSAPYGKENSTVIGFLPVQ
ncbi:hypothetical protein ABWK22_02795 [Gottfriedia acidiceleris]|uniref:hypothetical protein n=1 Tax=Gottfriedia acidiceleris TaxID=371036 RepID=UPI00339184F7